MRDLRPLIVICGGTKTILLFLNKLKCLHQHHVTQYCVPCTIYLFFPKLGFFRLKIIDSSLSDFRLENPKSRIKHYCEKQTNQNDPIVIRGNLQFFLF